MGVSPKTGQILARHSDINLIMNTDTMQGVLDRLVAVEPLPSMPESKLRHVEHEWDVSPAGRAALADLLLARAHYVAENVVTWIWPEKELAFMTEAGVES